MICEIANTCIVCRGNFGCRSASYPAIQLSNYPASQLTDQPTDRPHADAILNACSTCEAIDDAEEGGLEAWPGSPCPPETETEFMAGWLRSGFIDLPGRPVKCPFSKNPRASAPKPPTWLVSNIIFLSRRSLMRISIPATGHQPPAISPFFGPDIENVAWQQFQVVKCELAGLFGLLVFAASIFDIVVKLVRNFPKGTQRRWSKGGSVTAPTFLQS